MTLECKWRGPAVSATHYRCQHPLIRAPGGVSLNTCAGCAACDKDLPAQYLGDRVAGAIHWATGRTACGKCEERKEQLNAADRRVRRWWNACRSRIRNSFSRKRNHD